jgi:Aldo/keto reductase family
MTEVPHVTLNDGTNIPQLGFGVFQTEPQDTVRSAVAALEGGYRHIDTAQMYENEKQVGEAIRVSGVPRDEAAMSVIALRAHGIQTHGSGARYRRHRRGGQCQRRSSRGTNPRHLGVRPGRAQLPSVCSPAPSTTLSFNSKCGSAFGDGRLQHAPKNAARQGNSRVETDIPSDL